MQSSASTQLWLPTVKNLNPALTVGKRDSLNYWSNFVVKALPLHDLFSIFQTAFSPSKRTEAIVFAQKEILNYIAQNIIHETPESLSNQFKYVQTDLSLV